MTPERWKKIRSEEVANCRVFRIRRDLSIRENDAEEREAHSFYCIESSDWVNVIPVTTDGEVVLIEQYRHGIDEITLEIPGGMVDDDEDPEVAALRELKEETGYTAEEVTLIGRSHPNPAIQGNWVYHFLATGCEKTSEPEFDGTEHVVSRHVELGEVPGLIADGSITHSLVIAAFHWHNLSRNIL